MNEGVSSDRASAEAAQRAAGELMAWAEGFSAGAEGWILIGDDKYMPRPHETVALVDIRRWANVGGDRDCNVYACGSWEPWGGGFWSVHGERAISKDAFTHWIPLPAAPTASGLSPEARGSDEP